MYHSVRVKLILQPYTEVIFVSYKGNLRAVIPLVRATMARSDQAVHRSVVDFDLLLFWPEALLFCLRPEQLPPPFPIGRDELFWSAEKRWS